MDFLRILLNASCYFVIFRFLIWLAFRSNPNLSNTIYYHYSDGFIWYLIWFILPILSSVLIAIKLQFRFLQKVGIALLPLLIIGTIIGGYFNQKYWGYPLKRPTVFKELKEATKIFTITHLEKMADDKTFKTYTDTTLTEQLYGREDLYYGNLDRPIMTFVDRSYLNTALYDWHKISKDENKKASSEELSLIFHSLINSNLLVKPDKGYEGRGDNLSGRLIEFQTFDSLTFYHLTLEGGEVANDHYPVYEVLFTHSGSARDIQKSQIFYTDFAGIEGFEYSNFASLLETLAFISILVIVLFINAVKALIKGKNAKLAQRSW